MSEEYPHSMENEGSTGQDKIPRFIVVYVNPKTGLQKIGFDIVSDAKGKIAECVRKGWDVKCFTPNYEKWVREELRKDSHAK